MQIAKAKFIGTTDSLFTNDQVYDVLAWSGNQATVVGDDNKPYSVSVGGPSWSLEYLAVLELKQLYP